MHAETDGERPSERFLAHDGMTKYEVEEILRRYRAWRAGEKAKAAREEEIEELTG